MSLENEDSEIFDDILDDSDFFHLSVDLVQFPTEEQVADLLYKIDTVEYPETGAALLCWQIDEQKGKNESPMQLAKRLFQADATLPMQPDTVEFLKLLYEDQIKQNNIDAMTGLGQFFLSRRTHLRNYAKAKEYFEMAYKNGDLLSSEYLGYIWYDGQAETVDYEKAFKYFVKAAFGGYSRSMVKVADFYRYGYYVEADPKEAFSIYRQIYQTLAEDEIPEIGAEVYMRMGECYMEGIGTEKNMRTAQLLLSRSEILFYDRIKRGYFEQKKDLEHVITCEKVVREKLMKELPDFSWTDKFDSK